MVKVAKVVGGINEKYSFQGRANVNFSIPVNMYPAIKKYNQAYLEKLKEVNGDGVKLPFNMGYTPISRGDILCFGEQVIVDEETGRVKVFPIEVFNEFSKYTVELPCLMIGPVDKNYDTLRALATPRMKEAIEKLKEDSERFRVRPYIEKYSGNEPDLED